MCSDPNNQASNHKTDLTDCNIREINEATYDSELLDFQTLSEIEDIYLCDLHETALAPQSINMLEALPSNIDRLDMAWCLTTTVVSTFITTSKHFAKWLEGIHDAASDKSGSFDAMQKILGKTLHHKDDWLDQYEGQWNTRDVANAYAQFHRLLGGHDIFAIGESLTPHNPFTMMIKQRESVLGGTLQATRHLIADTFSSQGLPAPFSSYVDSTADDGRSWNKIIDIVQELSIETTGNKQQAESIYSHLFTLRAQDFIGGGAALALTSAYLHARDIEDAIRKTQIRLISYSMSFFAQAIVGATRQNGIPYINYPLGGAMAKELASLIFESNRRTQLLDNRARHLHEEVIDVIDEHNVLQDLL